MVATREINLGVAETIQERERENVLDVGPVRKSVLVGDVGDLVKRDGVGRENARDRANVENRVGEAGENQENQDGAVGENQENHDGKDAGSPENQDVRAGDAGAGLECPGARAVGAAQFRGGDGRV